MKVGRAMTKRTNKMAMVQVGSLVWDIDGMDCAACAARIEKLIAAQDGVAAAQVNFALKRAYAQLKPQAEVEKIVDAVENVIAKAGYRAFFVEAAEATAAKAAGGKPLNATDFAAREKAELRHVVRAFWLAFSFTLPIFIVEMGSHFLALLGVNGYGLAQSPLILSIECLLATFVLFVPGRVFFIKGIPPLLHGYPNMNSLVAVGAFVAWGYSTVHLIFKSFFGAGSGFYFESAAVIVTLILLGRVLEAQSRGRAGAAIKALAKLAPKTARIREDNKIEEIAVSAIEPGMCVVIRPWEKLPVDGTVLEGASAIDESMLTGEAFPVGKKQGDKIFAGTVNGAGTIIYKAEGIGKQTVLAQIQQMVEQAQATKLPISALADKIAAWFVPAVFAIALATFLLWTVFAPSHGLGGALSAAVSVLIIACPCAMGLATPMAVIVGTGRAARLGVLFRRGDALQKLCDTQITAFDKTGTLTMGKPQLAFFTVAKGFDRAALTERIIAVEAASEHPIAAAFRQNMARSSLKIEQFSAIPGKGIKAVIKGEWITIGSAAFLAELGVKNDIFHQQAEYCRKQGLSPIYAAVDNKPAALFAVHDPVRSTARAALSALQEQGLYVAVITGDSKSAAQKLAAELKFDDIKAEVKPADKAAIVQKFQQSGKTVAFVGDGINDAPALSTADVGLAIGTGTDVAIEAADIVLMSGDPAAVVRAYAISRAVLRNIKQNLFWAFAYNIILIPIAAGVLVPFGGYGFSPALAAGAMALSSLFVVGNALRLKHFTPFELKVK